MKETPDRLIDGASYNLGACTGIYNAASKWFECGNHYVLLGDTIYSDHADPLYLSDLREFELTRNERDARKLGA